MKRIKNISRVAVLLVLALVIFSCEKENVNGGDDISPGTVTEISTESTQGGVIIRYTLPLDADVSYVKATYVSSLGKEMFSVCSAFENKIVIEGLNDTEVHTAVLEVVDISGNKSKPINIDFIPLESHIEVVKRELVVEPTFGGVALRLKNDAEKTVYIYLTYTDDEGNEITSFYSSSKKEASFYQRGLQSSSREFFIQVEDFYGNKTDIVSKGFHTPSYEVEIDKSKWTLVSSLSVDGNAWEGKTSNMFDGVVDTKDSSGDNSYCMIWRNNNNGALNFPLDIVINMNADVVMSRVQVWQRAFWYGNDSEYFYYQNENFKAFDLYVSNDLQEWTQVGSFDIGDPKNEDGVAPQDAIEEAIAGHIFVLDAPTEPFRYLKFSITENYGSEEYVNVSELSMFGI